MTGYYHRYFFAMAGEPKIDPMELIFGTLTVNVLTNRLMDEKMPILDNSYPDLAYPMQPTQNVRKCNKTQL